MSTRQDQLHSYQFAVQRVLAALVLRETDPVQSPLRRVAGATLAGALVAAIGVGVAAVWGVVAGGGRQEWRTPNAVLVEKETGARYVYRDGRLHPVANLGSALLLGGGAPRRVGRASLADVPRGLPVGIPGAPDALPPRRALGAAPWAVCAVPRRDGPAGVVHVGRPPAGGVPLGERGLLLRVGATEYLVWQQRRYRLHRPGLVRKALGWAHAPATPVPAALLRGLPAGADLGGPPLPGAGRAARGVPGARVGDVFVVRGQAGGADQYAVAVHGGLAPVTALQARLLGIDQRGDGRPTPLSVAEFARAPQRPPLTPVEVAPPATAPPLVAGGGGMVCADVPDDGGAATVRVQVPPTDLARAVPTAGRGGARVDYVAVPPGGGALVQAAASPGAPHGAVLVVTDIGWRFPVGGPDAQRALGYEGV
ncbi:MAG TPA: type VII secretion protein EccB, partial [Pilimelia sp.]|nr:type VII secretion protein EccB [Pilimelia sp.]